MRNSIVWAPWHPLQNSHIMPVPVICYLGNSYIPAAQVAGWLPCGTSHFSGRATSVPGYVQAHCVWGSCLGLIFPSLVTSKLHCGYLWAVYWDTVVRVCDCIQALLCVAVSWVLGSYPETMAMLWAIQTCRWHVPMYRYAWLTWSSMYIMGGYYPTFLAFRDEVEVEHICQCLIDIHTCSCTQHTHTP